MRKHQISRPGQSRVKHEKIQADTLGQEWKNKNRKNVFQDGRIDKKKMNTLDIERVMVEKYAIEARKKAKNRIFDSGIGEVGDEEEILTHRGKSLADMERFDESGGSDDEDNDAGHLSKEQTEALFGGGILQNKQRDHKEHVDIV